MSDDAIRVRGLTKHFGAVFAVDGMDLAVPRGTAFGFIGPNGAGKTTFIKLLLGIAHPTAGDVNVLGGAPADVKIRRRIGYLPERLSMPPNQSAMAFLRSVGRLKGLPGRTLDVAIPKVLETVGLDEAAWRRRTDQFSKGMRQRTGLAAALLGDPELLVLDEPTDGIDPIGRAKIRRVIADAAKGGATVFLNSHLLSETEKICDHVAIVNRGKVVLSGAMKELLSERAFKVSFAVADDADRTALDSSVTARGFVVDEDARARGDRGAFRFTGGDAAALSAALKGCLDDGHVVIHLDQALKDLETVLEEIVGQAS